jgi:2,4-dienoyl-CoA reductase-like NADH-dependent reductase (Old Yellow Enzyme family)
MSQFQHLFQPIQVGPMRVPNRICETTNTINSSQIPGAIDEHFIAHHLAKARAARAGSATRPGCSTRRSRPRRPTRSALSVGFASHFPIWQNPPFAEGLTKFYGELHKVGAIAIAQLTHLSAVWAPSAVPPVGAQDYVPHVMGEDEIEFHFESYADAAEAAKRFGADGIEMHCAHETLGYTFLSPVTNRRTDRWGGGPQSASASSSRLCGASAAASATTSGSASASAARSSARAATTTSRCARCSTTSARPACSISSTSTSATAGARPRTCRTRTTATAVP